jgi:hypothetical protein
MKLATAELALPVVCRIPDTQFAGSATDPAWPPNKEYVAVPDALLAKTAALRPYLVASFRYAQTLRPKAPAEKKARPKAKPA